MDRRGHGDNDDDDEEDRDEDENYFIKFLSRRISRGTIRKYVNFIGQERGIRGGGGHGER